jgi:hypothetical protein
VDDEKAGDAPAQSEDHPDWLADHLPPKPYAVVGEKGNFRLLVIPDGRWNEERD